MEFLRALLPCIHTDTHVTFTTQGKLTPEVTLSRSEGKAALVMLFIQKGVLRYSGRRHFSSRVIPGCVRPSLETPNTFLVFLARPAARHEVPRNTQNLIVKENSKYFALSLQIRLDTKLGVDLSKPTRKSSWLQQ